jgi:hypothetical protein
MRTTRVVHVPFWIKPRHYDVDEERMCTLMLRRVSGDQLANFDLEETGRPALQAS